ncbi:hypothetical protein C2S51_022289 [Perilla frutescens var. frutescens]|nr:hypothetical protein C2S51_022289 [Perilla frutescens var. frutescens]
MAEYKFWQRRESRNMKVAKNQKVVASNILEAIAQLSNGDAAATRMKIVVKKEDLKQVLEAIRDGRRGPPSTAALLEQRLNLLRPRQNMRAAGRSMKGRTRFGSWRPVLQTIPE